MRSSESEPCLIGIDWGTSSLRAFLIGNHGEVLDTVSAPQGIMQVGDRDFDPIFERVVRPWLEHRALPIVASGMITSRNGWRETPYIRVPSGAEELAKHLVRHQSSSGIELWFVTGLTTERDGAPDVMRGEETQIVGATAAGMGDGIYVMPGTHSKWISVLGGKIEDYSTYMTGELFGVLKAHTILGTLMVEGPFNDTGFKLGVEASLAGAGDLLHRLFRVRTLPLFGRIGTEMAADYLSGMLIGDEIRAAAGNFGSTTVTIVGGSDLAQRYARAFELAGLNSRMAPDNIAALGHFMIAREAGLLP